MPNAELAYREAAATDRVGLDQLPGDTDFTVDLANDFNRLAQLENQRRAFTAALAWCDQAAATVNPVQDKSREQADVRHVLSTTYAWQATALCGLKRCREALGVWDKSLALSPPRERAARRLGRAATLAAAGHHSEAVTEAEAVGELDRSSGSLIYDAACVHALASGAAGQDTALPSAQRRQLVERYGSRAVALLTRARAAGFFKDRTNLAHMKKDPDLDPIRDRADLKLLFVELEREIGNGAK